jgi:hypothetical protein
MNLYDQYLYETESALTYALKTIPKTNPDYQRNVEYLKEVKSEIKRREKERLV